jgi:hypothetical protein
MKLKKKNSVWNKEIDLHVMMVRVIQLVKNVMEYFIVLMELMNLIVCIENRSERI